MLRNALCGREEGSGDKSGEDEGIHEKSARYGFRPFPRSADIVTNTIIDQLREEAGD
ncbi:MAG: hypothetical protein O2780_05105 [Proteobacteria bacterium]|nr:hypothetical protein [Pseudomonadota bacterium]MDA1298970.1 hypothetical protein [Pseudomonadota bacterium]